ncbi:MAG: response regulator, partial [candidate division NC10 bacterium]|nr:response regulator [candidate division NC10 bacterium]
DLLSDTLTSQGYEVLTAGDGMEALDKVRQHTPSYIFLDLILPKIDGVRVCRYLKEDPRYASIPVVILTGIAAEEPSRLKEIGADAYIAKGKVEEVMGHVLSTLRALEEKRESLAGRILGLEKIYPRTLVRALLFTRRHQELLLRNMAEGVIEADGEGKILYLNPAALRILEREEFELIGSSIASLWSPSQQEALSSLLARLASPTPRQETFTLTYGEKTLNLHFANLLEGGTYAGLLLLLQDISSLTKKIEELSTLNEVGKVLNSTLELETILNLVMERVKEMMKVEAGSLLLFDETTQELVFEVALGPSAAQLKGMRLAPSQGIAGWVFQHGQPLLIPDVASDSRFYRKVDETTGFTTKSMICVPLQVKEKMMGVIQVINKLDGRAFDVSDLDLLMAIAVHTSAGIENARLFKDLQLAYQDIKTKQEQLARSEHEKLKALGEMAAGVAHDFNNTIQAILARVQLLQDQTSDEEMVRWLKVVEQAALDGADTVRRIQEFARVRTDKDFVTLDLKEIIEDAVIVTQARWKNEAQAKGIKIEVETELASLPPVQGNASELREVFTNMILNSIDALPQGGRIRFLARGEADQVIVSVEDNGLGMSEEVRKRVFDPFFTTKGVKGTGLGMSVAFGIISRHGGSIEIQSAEGKGTKFIVRLPVGKEVEERVVPERAREVRTGHILVVDDVKALRDAFSRMLSRAGHSVRIAASGREALELFHKEDFDMVITDLGMPDMSGWEVARSVKERKPQVPVILITGWGAQLDDQKAKESGVDLILSKPFTIREILRVASEALAMGNRR